jgi:molybdopterin synthase catalytic subunit
MKRQLTVTSNPIEESALIGARERSLETGAVVVFLGVVRGTEGGQPISGLDYEAFQLMAERQFQLLFDEMEKRWPIQSVRLVHRVGPVKAGEASLWVELTAAHRQEAFAACEWLIDSLKQVVPIWKKPIE